MRTLNRLPAARTLAAGLLATTMLAAPLVIAAEAGKGKSPVSVEATEMPADFSAVISAVRPTVVSVHVERASAPVAFDGLPRFGDDHPFNFFRKRYGREFGPNGFGKDGPEAPAPHRMPGVGSGFFISADGYIVTNNHVVDRAERISVRLQNGDTHEARLLGADPKTDLALLKIVGDGFDYVEFAGGAAPRVGQWVVTVGAPFGLGGSATAGIISAAGRDIGSGPYDDYLQIDAPINRGNSGGPAFDLKGQVVGVNTAIVSPHGGSAGVGFAIPATLAKAVIDDLKDDGKVERGWLGVQIQPMTADLAKALGVEEAKGALIASIAKDAPAAKAGLEAGDLIVGLDGAAIETPRDLARRVASAGPEASIELTLYRNGEKLTKTVPLARMPGNDKAPRAEAAPDEAGDAPKLGMALADSNGNAVVTAVRPGSEADRKGIRPGTAVLAVAGKKTASAADVVAAVAAARGNGEKVVLMQVETKFGRRFVAFDLSGNA